MELLMQALEPVSIVIVLNLRTVEMVYVIVAMVMECMGLEGKRDTH